MESSSVLPGTFCPACVNTATVAAPFIQLCKDTNQKWTEISNSLLNLDETISRSAKSSCVCIDNNEIKIIESRDSITNAKKALKLVKKTLAKPLATIQDVKAEDTDFKCPECDKVYPSIYLLNAHLKDIDKKMCYYCKQIIDIDTFADHVGQHGAVLFTCSICKAMFKIRANYLRHVKLCCKKGTHVCVECSQSFVNASNLVAHYAAKHNPKVCAACDKRFMSKVCFKNHAKYCANSKEVNAKYICDYCSKEYSFKNTLRLHIRFSHVVGWEYQCEQCGKKFSNPAHLREHDNKHNRVNDRYVCNVCGSKYSTRRGYERHYKRHFNENGEVTATAKKKRASKKLQHCVLCNFVTSDRKTLQKHLNVKHNVVQWEVSSIS